MDLQRSVVTLENELFHEREFDNFLITGHLKYVVEFKGPFSNS